MPTLRDSEFGEITIRRSAKARAVRISMGPDGRLRASLPIYAPPYLVKRLLKQSRSDIRHLYERAQSEHTFRDGEQIGKSHSLSVRDGQEVTVRRHGQRIVLTMPTHASLDDVAIKQRLRAEVQKALRKEANSYLPRRLDYLARQHGYRYETVRFTHASSRWGSCSSNGTISLNIALMQLPFELIDYVLGHELAHTVEMNHSDTFWQRVEAMDPEYRRHKKELAGHSPAV